MYLNEYVSEVKDGLERMVITTDYGREISVDAAIKNWCEHVKRVRDDYHGSMFFCGNGASATMAEHMSHDWFKNAMVNTHTCAETAHLTAISNDLSFEDVFSYRIDRTLSQSDMLVAISSSGESANIIKAINTAKKKGAYVVTLSGMTEENASRKIGDLNFYIPLCTYGLIESAHALLLHTVLDFYILTYK